MNHVSNKWFLHNSDFDDTENNFAVMLGKITFFFFFLLKSQFFRSTRNVIQQIKKVLPMRQCMDRPTTELLSALSECVYEWWRWKGDCKNRYTAPINDVDLYAPQGHWDPKVVTTPIRPQTTKKVLLMGSIRAEHRGKLVWCVNLHNLAQSQLTMQEMPPTPPAPKRTYSFLFT